MAKNSLTWHRFDTSDAQAQALARQVADDLETTLVAQSNAVLSVPGGATPLAFLRALSEIELQWSKVTVILNDERWVPLTDAQSNEAMVRKALQCNFAKAVTIVGFYSDQNTLSEGVFWFNKHRSELLSLDVCVLGMGTDGHTASLFPRLDNLSEALDSTLPAALVIAKTPGNAISNARVSLNLSSILTAKKHYVLIKGGGKKEVLEQASIEKTQRWPVSYLVHSVAVDVYYSS